MDEIRQNIGFCPQHNVLMDFLTVGDHLRFFAVVSNHILLQPQRESSQFTYLHQILRRQL